MVWRNDCRVKISRVTDEHTDDDVAFVELEGKVNAKLIKTYSIEFRRYCILTRYVKN